MNKSQDEFQANRPAGYMKLLEDLGIDTIPNWHHSLVAKSNVHRVSQAAGQVEEVYPKKYWPGETVGDHLEFALKYDGVNLAILSLIFRQLQETDLLNHIVSKPTGKYVRKLWFLFEFLTEKVLPLDDLSMGNYIDLLNPKDYCTNGAKIRIRRQRINDNLMGNRKFCPTVRKTEILLRYEESQLTQRCEQVVSGYSPALLRRALQYLYNKETKSSFEIEKIHPTPSRTERFVSLLSLAEKDHFCKKAQLIKVQNRIVDERFRSSNYRINQNYVGETVAWQNEKIHFVSPRPEDLPNLMEGLISAHERMNEGTVSPVIHAAAISFGFVFLHPFEDGNGRLHRFLIHNILARKGFTPRGLMFPISAAMLNKPGEYDYALESFSRPLLPLVDYSIDEAGHMTVQNETSVWYRFLDLTAQAEALYGFIDNTIEEELKNELDFLANYDQTKVGIQEIVDMPDKLIDLFIRFCLQNNGKLSKKKRESQFSFLLEEELTLLEKAVSSGYGSFEV